MQGIAFAGPLVCMLACAVLTPAAGAVTPRLTAMIVGILSGAKSVAYNCPCCARGPCMALPPIFNQD